jgi:hypothetical protein
MEKNKLKKNILMMLCLCVIIFLIVLLFRYPFTQFYFEIKYYSELHVIHNFLSAISQNKISEAFTYCTLNSPYQNRSVLLQAPELFKGINLDSLRISRVEKLEKNSVLILIYFNNNKNLYIYVELRYMDDRWAIFCCTFSHFLPGD